MVCAAQPLAVAAGVDVLRDGGSAVDAAIATNACLAVVEPTSCGLGGDLFAMLWDPTLGRLVGFNGSGRAPRALTRERITPESDGTISLRSPASWTVPGCVDGWSALHARYGRVPLERLLAPAIAHARDGFAVTPVIAGEWARGAQVVGGMPGFADVFLVDDGAGRRAPRTGERFRNPALAMTLEQIAEGGADVFYRGPIAAAIVRYSEAGGGAFAQGDFASHASTWDEPIRADYRGVTLWELPPNGQGLAALQLLQLLERLDGFGALAFDEPERWHLMVEAKKLAYGDRARWYADPAFASVPVEALLAPDYAEERARRVDRERAAGTDAPGDPLALARRETTYLATADRDGMMVSWIQSNYTGFGSGHVVPELGFGIQNRGALFALDPAHPNALVPGKRPFHTIIPAFITRSGQPLVAFGLMGGDMQAQGHAQIVCDLVDFGLDLQQAGNAPRFHHVGSSEPTGTRMAGGGIVQLEAAVPAAVRHDLEQRGHRVDVAPPGAFGGYQAVGRDPASGRYAGASEPRKDGCARGL